MTTPFHRILVAVDFSETSQLALDAAADLARRFDAELHLVHAFDVPVPMFNPYAVSVPVDATTGRERGVVVSPGGDGAHEPCRV